MGEQISDIILTDLSDEDLVVQMHDDLYDGLTTEISMGTQILLDRGWSAHDVLQGALVEGMRIVGIDFRDGILFVPEVLLAANAMKAAALAELDGADMATAESRAEGPGETVQQGQQQEGGVESEDDGDVSDDEAITAAQYARDAAARARLVAHSVLEVEHECCRLLCTLAGTATRHFPPIAASMVHGGGLGGHQSSCWVGAKLIREWTG